MSQYESPEFEIVQKEESFELRKYPAFYLVEYDNASDPNIENGFNKLFAYIGSNNSENKKISMTIPVIEEVKSDQRKIAFVVPKSFGDKIPKPKSKHLNVTAFEEGLYAVITYSGRSTDSMERQKSEMLHQWIQKKHWTIQSNDKLAIYNAPFTPGIFRKNEIMIKVGIESETK